MNIIKTRMKKIALNLDYAKNMKLEPKKSDSVAELKDGSNRGDETLVSVLMDITYYVDRRMFSDAYAKEFSSDEDVKTKLNPTLKDKAKQYFGNSSNAYVNVLWDAFCQYVKSNMSDTVAKDNFGLTSNGTLSKEFTELLRGQGITLESPTGYDNIEISYKDVTYDDNKLSFVVEGWIADLIADKDNVGKYHQ
jgi:hypothetical protein